MLNADYIISALLQSYTKNIPAETINPIWLEYADTVIREIENIKYDLDATNSLLRLLQLMTDIHCHIIKKDGALCRVCFEESTKRLFLQNISANAPWEKNIGAAKNPTHWGTANMGNRHDEYSFALTS